MTKHYLGEAGTDIVFDCGVDVSNASQAYIKYIKSDAITTGSFAASVYSSYSQLAKAIGTYFLKYTSAASDFDQPGEWKFQTHIGAVDGTWNGETVRLNLYDAFQ